MGKPPTYCSNCVYLVGFFIMALSAMVALMVSVQGPALEYVTYTYKLKNTDRSCNVNGYHIGSEFGKVIQSYSLLVGVVTATSNLLLVRHIKNFRSTGTFSTVFCFFFLIVLPIRLIHFALQVIEFDVIGGRKYTMILSNQHLYPNCQILSGDIDAMFLMHARTLFLTLDFITLNTLILTVSFVYSSVEQPV